MRKLKKKKFETSNKNKPRKVEQKIQERLNHIIFII